VSSEVKKEKRDFKDPFPPARRTQVCAIEILLPGPGRKRKKSSL